MFHLKTLLKAGFFIGNDQQKAGPEGPADR
jgi:hypothetical protein